MNIVLPEDRIRDVVRQSRKENGRVDADILEVSMIMLAGELCVHSYWEGIRGQYSNLYPVPLSNKSPEEILLVAALYQSFREGEIAPNRGVLGNMFLAAIKVLRRSDCV